jgi:hypothetical protein
MHATLVQTLRAAGWTLDPLQCIAADLEYDNGAVTLRVMHEQANPRFNFSITDRSGAHVLVSIDYGDDLATVLAKIVSLQDRFTLASADDLLSEIHAVARETFVFVDGEPVPISEAERSLSVLDWQEHVRSRLVGAGWTCVDDRTLAYRGKLPMRVMLAARKNAESDDALYLLFPGEDPRDPVAFILYFHDALARVLDAIVALQDSIDVDDYESELRELVRACPETFFFHRGEAAQIVDDVAVVLGRTFE